MGVLKLWIKVENQYTYYTFAEIDGILGAGIKSVKVLYRGTDLDEGLFISNIIGSGINLYLISDKITDDINFTTNIPQLGDSGTFSLYSKPPTSEYTLYTDGERFIKVGSTSSKCRISTIGASFKGNIHNGFRYGRDGVLLTFPNPYSIDPTSHNSEKIIPNQTNDVEWMILEGEDSNTIKADAIVNFTDQEYKYQTSDASNWNGWYKVYSSGVFTGEYQPFGDSDGTKKVGYLRFLSSTLHYYILDIDILEVDGKWTLTYYDIEYTSLTRPDESGGTFTNEDAEPSEITLTFQNYTSASVLKNHFTVGVITK